MALHFDSKSHSTLLSASLQDLQVSGELQDTQAAGANETDVITEFLPNLKETSVSHNMAGDSAKPPLRFGSGASSPYTTISSTGAESPLPDPNGLGWPGVCYLRLPDKQFFVVLHLSSSHPHSLVSQQNPPSID